MRGMAVRKFHGACPPALRRRRRIAHGRKRFHHFQIHVGVRFGSDDAYRRVPPRETCGFGRRFHSGGKPDALDRPAGKAFQSFQAQRQVRATFGARDGVHFIHDNGINGGKYPSRLEVSSRNSDSGVVRISGGWLTILRRSCGVVSPLRMPTLTFGDGKPIASHCPAMPSNGACRFFRDIRAQRLQGETYQHFDTIGRLAALESHDWAGWRSFRTSAGRLRKGTHSVLPGAGGSHHQNVLTGLDGGPGLPLRFGRMVERMPEPCSGRFRKTSPNIRTYVRLWHRLQTCQPSIGAINPFL